jgi:hypothetical protein
MAVNSKIKIPRAPNLPSELFKIMTPILFTRPCCLPRFPPFRLRQILDFIKYTVLGNLSFGHYELRNGDISAGIL